ncbi:glycine cleavage T C-terminal barrel domain-containing protein [Sedimentitalea sp. XS_ASV28]|uniref:glycine cleavage T C-terminal barrel domain-containing protein n=1 Tax=Sedimentitalea sp. XS_ASV28 TaxID=3241296 RepID=UPI00351866CB
MDVARFVPYAANKEYIKQTTGQFYTRRFVMTYGHTAGKSLAIAMIDRTASTEETEWAVHVVGAERPARVIAASPYDAKDSAMRGTG